MAYYNAVVMRIFDQTNNFVLSMNYNMLLQRRISNKVKLGNRNSAGTDGQIIEKVFARTMRIRIVKCDNLYITFRM